MFSFIGKGIFAVIQFVLYCFIYSVLIAVSKDGLTPDPVIVGLLGVLALWAAYGRKKES